MEISRVEAYLARLVRKRAPLNQEINHILSLIMRLPQDLCYEIFLAACITDNFEDRVNPLVLGSVCKAWRDFICSTPHFWTTIPMRIDHYSSQQESLLLEWLTRPGQCPLSIRLRHSPDVKDEDSEHAFPEDKASEDTLVRTPASSPFAVSHITAGVSERWFHIDFAFPERYCHPFRAVINISPSWPQCLCTSPEKQDIAWTCLAPHPICVT